MKKTTGMKIFLNMVILCISLLAFCSASFAEQLDPRWKWCYSTDRLGWYLDTKTIEYDASTQIATFWVLTLKANGKREDLYQQAISFKDKTERELQKFYYSDNRPYSTTFDPNAQIIRPDSPMEAVARNAAYLLNIAPLYEGGPNRWTWLRSNKAYGLYIAKDTLLYHPDTGKNSVWIKRSYPTYQVPIVYRRLFFFSLADGTVRDYYTGRYVHPIPESDEELILNAAKTIKI